MEEKLDADIFLKLFAQKKREIQYTEHAIQRARIRKLIPENELSVKRFEMDMYNNKPDVVVEQISENPEERKFKVYYKSPDGGFVAYILSIDGQIRLITTYKTSKSLQEKIYKHMKRGMYHEKH